MPPISVLLKPASSLCNMSCDYCFYCDEASKREISSYGFMAETTLKNVIRRTLLRAEGSAAYGHGLLGRLHLIYMEFVKPRAYH